MEVNDGVIILGCGALFVILMGWIAWLDHREWMVKQARKGGELPPLTDERSSNG